MTRFLSLRYFDLWLHPSLALDLDETGRIFQARFALVLAIALCLISLFRLSLSTTSFEVVNTMSAAVLSLLAVIAYRYSGRIELVSFIWLLILVSNEALRSWDQPAVFFPFFAWIPVSIGLVCFLSGSGLGGLFTIIVLIEGILSVRLSRDALLGGFSGNPDQLMSQVQVSLLLAEIIGGCAVYSFARIKERAENELQLRRDLRIELKRQQELKEIMGHLAHELNNPLAIIHAGALRYQFELSQGKLDRTRHEILSRNLLHASQRIQGLAADLRLRAGDQEVEQH